MSILEIYEKKCNDNSDICEHMPVLKKYAEECKWIIELGVRSIVSSWAFLAAKPKGLISVDIHHPSYYQEYDREGCNLDLVHELAAQQETSFEFIQNDSVTAKLPVCDLMFFDTLHTKEQLTAELKAHGDRVNKYMIFHDTESYKTELMPVILKFLNENKNWFIYEKRTNNNGLLIIKKQS